MKKLITFITILLISVMLVSCQNIDKDIKVITKTSNIKGYSSNNDFQVVKNMSDFLVVSYQSNDNNLSTIKDDFFDNYNLLVIKFSGNKIEHDNFKFIKLDQKDNQNIVSISTIRDDSPQIYDNYIFLKIYNKLINFENKFIFDITNTKDNDNETSIYLNGERKQIDDSNTIYTHDILILSKNENIKVINDKTLTIIRSIADIEKLRPMINNVKKIDNIKEESFKSVSGAKMVYIFAQLVLTDSEIKSLNIFQREEEKTNKNEVIFQFDKKEDSTKKDYFIFFRLRDDSNIEFLFKSKETPGSTYHKLDSTLK